MGREQGLADAPCWAPVFPAEPAGHIHFVTKLFRPAMEQYLGRRFVLFQGYPISLIFSPKFHDINFSSLDFINFQNKMVLKHI